MDGREKQSSEKRLIDREALLSFERWMRNCAQLDVFVLCLFSLAKVQKRFHLRYFSHIFFQNDCNIHDYVAAKMTAIISKTD